MFGSLVNAKFGSLINTMFGSIINTMFGTLGLFFFHFVSIRDPMGNHYKSNSLLSEVQFVTFRGPIRY